MNRVRVLIVDESTLTRVAVSRLLENDPQFEIAGTAASGRLALTKLNATRPDVVLLDAALTGIDGLQTLAELRKTHPTLPVIMFSRATERGSQATVDALLLGANGCVTKPDGETELERCVRGELTTKIKSVCGVRSDITAPVVEQRVVANAPLPVSGKATGIVAIAASTGGPQALATLLSRLPSDFQTPILIVQHMQAGLTQNFADSLRRQTGRDVREASADQPLDAASVWIAASDRHMIVTRRGVSVRVESNSLPPENSCRPAANVLFRSVAEVFGTSSLAVVLTGMGCDGLAGCRAIRQAGGTVLVQDEASSTVWGMPGQVANAGLAHAVLPLEGLSDEISRRVAETW